MQGTIASGGDADRPPEGGAERRGGVVEAGAAGERPLEDDGEHRRADRAADALEHVHLRRRVGELGAL